LRCAKEMKCLKFRLESADTDGCAGSAAEEPPASVCVLVAAEPT